MGLAAQQNNSREDRIRFLRGKIAKIGFTQSVNQALITPGVQNPQSAYTAIQEGRLTGAFTSTSSGGITTTTSTCCPA